MQRRAMVIAAVAVVVIMLVAYMLMKKPNSTDPSDPSFCIVPDVASADTTGMNTLVGPYASIDDARAGCAADPKCCGYTSTNGKIISLRSCDKITGKHPGSKLYMKKSSSPAGSVKCS